MRGNLLSFAFTFPLNVLAVNTAALSHSYKRPTVDLEYAKYQGETLPSGVNQFLGIRYAAPPVGDLRFEAPQDPLKEHGVTDADKHGKLCLATGDDPENDETSEDCLFLDVYAPEDANEDSDYPVFVFIQGGGFQSNSNPNLNGTGLVKASNDNTVVVTFNYRVGLFGFLPGSAVESVASLNNGLKDQRKVLEWVQKHIRKFGGNPKHVVIGGDSAGGASVTLHLTAYEGRNDSLFVGAAAESQSFATMLTVKDSEFIYNNLTERTGCADEENSLQCLKELDAKDLQKHDKVVPFPGASEPPLYMYGPTIDGGLVPDYTIRLFTEGKFLRIPVIFGDDTNEGTVFVPKNTSSYEESDKFIKSQFATVSSKQLEKINELYPQDPSQTFPNSGDFWRQASDAYGDIRYICPGVHLSDMYEKYGFHNCWNYHYAVLDKDDAESGLGVPHTVEVNSIWGPQHVQGDPPASYYTYNAAIIPVIQGYWTSFITTLNPNTRRTENSPEWTTWGENKNRIFLRTNETHMEKVSHRQMEKCNYLTSIAVDLRQ